MVRAGPSVSEAYASMTGQQQDAMDKIKASHDEYLAARLAAATREAVLAACIYDALEDRVPARVVAAYLGLSVTRVYQIRDEVARRRVTR
jgi:hypothetical protein